MFIPNTEQVWRYHKQKTVLLKFPAGTDFIPTESNSKLTRELVFYEPSIALVHEPAVPLLRDFTRRVARIIKLFDRP